MRAQEIERRKMLRAGAKPGRERGAETTAGELRNYTKNVIHFTLFVVPPPCLKSLKKQEVKLIYDASVTYYCINILCMPEGIKPQICP